MCLDWAWFQSLVKSAIVAIADFGKVDSRGMGESEIGHGREGAKEWEKTRDPGTQGIKWPKERR